MELNWPLAALIFGVFFVVFYRKEIATMLSSLKGISKDGVLFEPSINAQKADKKSRFDELSNVGNYKMLQVYEKNIIDGLKNDGLFHDNDTVKILLKHLALAQMRIEFEQIYKIIFGSQIFLLKRLNENMGLGLGKDYVDKYVLEAISNNEDLRDWNIDEYLSFLFLRELIRDDNGVYQITVKGHDFLSYLIAAGLKEDKLF
jgi:hypothetical protein